ADREEGRGDPEALRVVVRADRDRAGPAAGGREGDALAHEVRQTRRASREERRDARGVRRGEVEVRLAEERDVRERRASRLGDEGATPAGERTRDELGPAGRVDPGTGVVGPRATLGVAAAHGKAHSCTVGGSWRLARGATPTATREPRKDAAQGPKRPIRQGDRGGFRAGLVDHGELLARGQK